MNCKESADALLAFIDGCKYRYPDDILAKLKARVPEIKACTSLNKLCEIEDSISELLYWPKPKGVEEFQVNQDKKLMAKDAKTELVMEVF